MSEALPNYPYEMMPGKEVPLTLQMAAARRIRANYALAGIFKAVRINSSHEEAWPSSTIIVPPAVLNQKVIVSVRNIEEVGCSAEVHEFTIAEIGALYKSAGHCIDDEIQALHSKHD